jgi:hypothetical protein
MSNEKKKEKEEDKEDKEWVFFNCTFLGLFQQLLSFFARNPFCIDLIFIYFCLQTRCKIPIKWLEKCCEAIEYKSKHCASVSNLLDMLEKRTSKKQQPPVTQ